MSENTEAPIPAPAPSGENTASVDPKAAKDSAPAAFSGGASASTMADLNTKAPELAEAMKMGMALQITQQMERHGERMKELMQRQRRGE